MMALQKQELMMMALLVASLQLATMKNKGFNQCYIHYIQSFNCEVNNYAQVSYL